MTDIKLNKANRLRSDIGLIEQRNEEMEAFISDTKQFIIVLQDDKGVNLHCISGDEAEAMIYTLREIRRFKLRF